MRSNYNDIISRINEPPKWYDQNGTPHYDDFHPDLCPNIYAHHVGLFLIACQYCEKKFKVESHSDIFSSQLRVPPSKWHYGDPPIHDCVGDTMNCEDVAVLEFWKREGVGDWERMPELEGVIDV